MRGISTGVIVFLLLILTSYSWAEDITPQPKRVIVKPYAAYGPLWEPTREQVNEIISSLKEFVETQYSSLVLVNPINKLVEPVENYSLQFGGFYKEGKEIISVHAFCSRSPTLKRSSLQNWIWVDDGGGCYFQVNYDPRAKTFFDFHVNGSG